LLKTLINRFKSQGKLNSPNGGLESSIPYFPAYESTTGQCYMKLSSVSDTDMFKQWRRIWGRGCGRIAWQIF